MRAGRTGQWLAGPGTLCRTPSWCHCSSLHEVLCDGVDQPHELSIQVFGGKGGHVMLLLHPECVMGQEAAAT